MATNNVQVPAHKPVAVANGVQPVRARYPHMAVQPAVEVTVVSAVIQDIVKVAQIV